MDGFCWKKSVAIVLAAGNGKRMQRTEKKQFIPLMGKPMLYYSLKAFSDIGIGKIILVTAQEDFAYCKKQFGDTSVFNCPIELAEGGKERYDSVYAGLRKAKGADYVFIHDGARPCLEKDVLKRVADAVTQYGACVVAVPVKDTIKVVNAEGFAVETPDRSSLWAVQTPQVFSYEIIMDAYNRMMETLETGNRITDDAMVVETFSGHLVNVVEGSYRNIKVTTPEDIAIAEANLLDAWQENEKK